MTGKEASATRTVIIGTVEFNWRVWMILVWSSPVGLLLTALLWPLLSELAIFAFPLVWGAALFLIQRRTRDGLQLRTYQAMWDKRRSNTGQFFLCGTPIDINSSDYRTVTANAVAYREPEKASSETLVDVLSRVPLAPGVVSAAELDARTHAPAVPFAATDDPAEAARARREAEAAARPRSVIEPEPERIPAPAAQPFAAAHESAAAHVPQTTPAPVVVPRPAPAPVPTPVPVDPLFGDFDPNHHAEAHVDFTPSADPFAHLAPSAPLATPAAHTEPGPALERLDEATIGLEAPDDLPDLTSFFEAEEPTTRSRFGRKKDDQ